MRIIKGVVLAFTLLVAASGQVTCPTGPLTEDQLTTLVTGKVPEVRVRQFITSCGLNFVADDAAVKRLRAVGATAAELEAVRLASALRVKADSALWETAKERNSAAAYEGYLERFPQGMFAAVAREELEKLRAAERAAAEEAERKRRAEEEERAAQAAAEKRAEEERVAAEKRAAQELALPPSPLVVSGVSMEFVRIQPGQFVMGDVNGGGPEHRVRITKAFEMAKYEVTQAQWEAVMGNNPSYFKGADRPVEQVSWNDAQEFLSKLNARNDGYRYRLPAEAEWEYAARAGTTGDNAASLDSVAWYSANSNGRTHPVGQKRANAWGFYDMLGNVWEWCQDWYDGDYYRNSPAEDPRGPSSGSLRVLRGGSWGDDSRLLRVADRGRSNPDVRDNFDGFRCVRERRTAAEERAGEERVAASGQVPCPRPLSEELLTALVKAKVREGRVLQFIASCGLKFVADEGAVSRLKAAGATAAELEALPTAKRPLPTGPLVVNGVSMEFAPIPAGEFQMGSKSGDTDEKPTHRVGITKAFELGKYEVTQAQWEAVMGSNPSHFKGADRPVDSVGWWDAQEFLSSLNARNDGYRYRLPTEAEWEYAARAGTVGNNAGKLDSIAWYGANSKRQTHPVGQKQLNAWGLYDMQGNVWEWCQDWYDDSYYRNSPAKDPQGPSSGSLRVLRGGSWVTHTRDVRVTSRYKGGPVVQSALVGFRCVRERSP